MSVMGTCTFMEQYSAKLIKRRRFVHMFAQGTSANVLVHVDNWWERYDLLRLLPSESLEVENKTLDGKVEDLEEIDDQYVHKE